MTLKTKSCFICFSSSQILPVSAWILFFLHHYRRWSRWRSRLQNLSGMPKKQLKCNEMAYWLKQQRLSFSLVFQQPFQHLLTKNSLKILSPRDPWKMSNFTNFSFWTNENSPKWIILGFLPILSLCLEFNDINIKSSIDLATKFECGNLQNSIFSQKGPNYENWGILGFISIVSNRIDSSLDAGAV